MTWKEVFSHTFKALRETHEPCPQAYFPDAAMVKTCRSDDSDFCLEVVARQWLTEAQMQHAAERYRLGRSRSGKTIFWMIDETGQVLDGHIGSSWVSQMLQRRYPDLLTGIPTFHCLFGLHLVTLGTGSQCAAMPKALHSGACPQREQSASKVCLIESERSAVILSEIYPEYIWLAWVYDANLTIDKLEPLSGHRVVLYPRASEAKEDFTFCSEIASQARESYHLDITVSDILELHATPSQKARKIDLIDFLFEGKPSGSQLTQPSLTVREGFGPLSKPLANRWQEDVTAPPVALSLR